MSIDLSVCEDGRKFWNYTIYGFFTKETTKEQLNKIADLLESLGDPKLVIDALNFGYHRKLHDKLHKEGKCKTRGRKNLIQNFIYYYASSSEKAKERLDDWKRTEQKLREGFFHNGRQISNPTIWRIKKRLEKVSFETPM